VFSPLFITMVEIGEVGGILDEVLQRYAQIFDSMYRIQAKVLKAMIYPALLLGMTLLVGWYLLTRVFPTFINQLQTHGQPLPEPTALVLALSDLLVNYSLIIGIVIGASVFLVSAIRRTPAGAQFFSAMALRVPLCSSLIRHIELALFHEPSAPSCAVACRF
jgi:type IV pilus assembly protein PilC